MLARTIALAALVSVSAAAQETPDGPIGFSLGHGLATPEALAFPTTASDVFLAFDDGRLADVAVFGSASSYARDTRTRSPLPEPLVQYRNGVDRRVGLAVGFTFNTPAGEIRAGASGAYVYDRDQRVDYVLAEGDPEFPGDDGMRLQLDYDTAVESEDRRLYGAVGVNLKRTIRLKKTGEFSPSLGLAVGTYHRESGRALSAPRRAVAYLRLPVRVQIGDRFGLGLETTAGVVRESITEIQQTQASGAASRYVPITQVTVRALF